MSDDATYAPESDDPWAMFPDAPDETARDDPWTAFPDAPEAMWARGEPPQGRPPADAPRLWPLADAWDRNSAPAPTTTEAYAALGGRPGDVSEADRAAPPPAGALMRMQPSHPPTLDGPPPPGSRPAPPPAPQPGFVYQYARSVEPAADARVNPDLPQLIDPATGRAPPTRAVMTRDQRLGVLFNELQSYSGPMLDDGIRLTAHALINGDEAYGADRSRGHGSAVSTLPARMTPQQQTRYDNIARVYDGVLAERAQGVDPTNGATFFNQRRNPAAGAFEQPFNQSRTAPTAFVLGLDNSFPSGNLPAHGVAVYTFQDANGVRWPAGQAHPRVVIQPYADSPQ
jgi:hypothetical protein